MSVPSKIRGFDLLTVSVFYYLRYIKLYFHQTLSYMLFEIFLCSYFCITVMHIITGKEAFSIAIMNSHFEGDFWGHKRLSCTVWNLCTDTFCFPHGMVEGPENETQRHSTPVSGYITISGFLKIFKAYNHPLCRRTQRLLAMA